MLLGLRNWRERAESSIVWSTEDDNRVIDIFMVIVSLKGIDCKVTETFISM